MLSKRPYTNKDLINVRYGRLVEIPAALKASNELVGFCISYQDKIEGKMLFGKIWCSAYLASYNLGRTPLSIHRLRKQLHAVIDQIQPDLIWVSSDMFTVIIGFDVRKAGIIIRKQWSVQWDKGCYECSGYDK